MSQKTLALLVLPGVLAATALWMSGVSIAAPTPKVFRPAGLPFQIEAPDADNAVEIKRGADKKIRFHQTVNVKLDSKSKADLVKLAASHEAPSEGGRLKLTVVDGNENKITVFGFDPSTNTLTLAADGDKVSVVKNPNGGYSVDGTKAATGKDALALLKQKPAYKAVPPQSILAAYAAAQRPLPEVKTCIDCDANSITRAASNPAVCTVFKDLCECIACDATGKDKNCTKCP